MWHVASAPHPRRQCSVCGRSSATTVPYNRPSPMQYSNRTWCCIRSATNRWPHRNDQRRSERFSLFRSDIHGNCYPRNRRQSGNDCPPLWQSNWRESLISDWNYHPNADEWPDCCCPWFELHKCEWKISQIGKKIRSMEPGGTYVALDPLSTANWCSGFAYYQRS